MNKTSLLATLAIVASAPLSQAALISINLTNADFQADLGQPNTVSTGWTSVAGSGTNSTPSNYFENGISGFSGDRLALLKSDGGNYIQQALTTSEAGAVDATTFGQYTVDFNFGYRRDGSTNGDLNLRVALWNITDGVELAGHTFTIVNPGVGANSMSAQTAVLAYDNTQASLLGDTIALRVMSMDADLGSVAWNRTGMVDDFSVNATAVPEPATYGLMGAGALASAAFVRRRKRA